MNKNPCQGADELKTKHMFDDLPWFLSKNIEEVTLDVYFKIGTEKSFLFDDAHDGYDYTKGKYSYRTFKLLGKEKQLIIQQHKSGRYDADYKTFKINFHGLPFEIDKIQIDNEEIDFKKMQVNGDNTLTIHKDFNELHIKGVMW